MGIVKNIDSKLLDYSDLRLTQILFFDDRWMLILTHPFLTQPLISIYHPRALKNHFFKLPIFSSTYLINIF